MLATTVLRASPIPPHPKGMRSAQMMPADLAVLGETESSFHIPVKIIKQVFKRVPIPPNGKPICFFYLLIVTKKKQVLSAI